MVQNQGLSNLLMMGKGEPCCCCFLYSLFFQYSAEEELAEENSLQTAAVLVTEVGGPVQLCQVLTFSAFFAILWASANL